MIRSVPISRRTRFVVAPGLALLAAAAGAQIAPRTGGELDAFSFADARLRPDPATVPLVADPAALAPEGRDALDAFRAATGGTWSAQVDRRTGRLAYVEGSGIPWFPGAGNDLAIADVAAWLGGSAAPDLAAHDRRARAEAPRFAAMLGFDPAALALNLGRSGAPAPHLWFVDYDLVLDGRAVEGARVLFTVNNGNLVSVGGENLPAPGTVAPQVRLEVAQALALVAERIGGLGVDDEWLDAGSYHLLPALVGGPDGGAGFEPGRGRGVVGVWQFVFRRAGRPETVRARVDAASGELVELADVNDYGSVTGGTYAGDRPTPEVVRPMPYANVGAGVYANSAGVFAGTSGTTTLDGQYVKIVDECGAISKAADGSGVIALGSSGGTDCTTPGSGGAGNTHASRTQFYQLNRAKEVARGWLPGNAWINAKLTANVNLNQTCNAFWNGSTVNFFKSGGGCANTGELPGVSLHEYGHGIDANDGNGSSLEKGTGETYGDFTAAIATHSSCIGNGFDSNGSNCGGYGNPCTSCSGIRDIDWAKHVANTPATVANWAFDVCPLHQTYYGPCGTEGHCESLISSEALWDLAARDLPGAGTRTAWAVVDRLWFLSRSTATTAYQCNTAGFPWTSNGCFTGSYFRSMRAVDDDNGNLADGTPHGAALGAAFNRHGIACTSDAGWNVTHVGVTPPAAPSLTATPGNNSVALAWTSSSGVYDVYRNEAGCNAGFTRIANDRGSASYDDSAVANGLTYYYQVIAQASGNEAASSAPSGCVQVTPAAQSAVLANGVPVTNLSGAAGSEQRWTMPVPAGASNLAFQMSGGSGDADLYVRFGSPPDTTTYDCRPFLTGNNETCSFPTPQAGTWHVMIRAFQAYSGVSLVGSYTSTGALFEDGFESGNTSAWSLVQP
ncbi:MAG: hypothetical protein AMXMBFR36_24590 [Acidobacteriota bacterium]